MSFVSCVMLSLGVGQNYGVLKSTGLVLEINRPLEGVLFTILLNMFR